MGTKRLEMRRRIWVSMKRRRYSDLYKATLRANEVITKERITADGWTELVALELDERMTEKDIKHLRKLCETELLLLLEHFGNQDYDDITIKGRVQKPKSISYTNSDLDNIDEISRKSSFRKIEIPRKEKKDKKEKKSSWSLWGSMKNAVGYGDKDEDEDEVEDGSNSIITSGTSSDKDNLTYSIN